MLPTTLLGSPSQVRVSRVGHDGTEMWGQGGVAVPHTVGSVAQHSPLGIAPDGSGGACVAFIETWPSYELFRFAHFTASGAFSRTVSVDNPGTIREYDHLSIKMLPLANSDVLLAWTQRSPVTKLHAARFTLTGTLVWHTDVNLNYSHRETVVSNTRTSWDICSDGFDGALITWLRLQVGTPEIGAQRIGSEGAVWWGTDGHRLWSGYSTDFHDPVIVGDVTGGAFVVMSHLGRITAQHLDPWGNELWPAGGLLLQDSGTPYWAQSTNPSVCDDGAYGFIVVHGNEDLFGQRVDYWGNILWGSGVGIGQRAGQQYMPDVARDGVQGAVVVWQDKYYSRPGEPWHVLTGMRLSGSGGAIWGPTDLYMSWTTYDPHDPEVVSDGSGGALCAFPNYDISDWADDVWALGIGPGGLSAIEPPAGVPADGNLTAYPNPFGTSTRLEIYVPRAGAGSLAIYDPSGRRVRTLVDGMLAPGRQVADWDGRDDSGRFVGSGVYLIRLESPSCITTRRVVRLR